MKPIHEVMKAARLDRGLTQNELSERSGIPLSTISSIERGRHTPTILVVEALADALKLSIDEYIGRKAPADNIWR